MPAGIVKNKLDVLEFAAPCPQPVTTLVVLLPGAYDTAEDFVRHQFVLSLHRHGVAADVVAADAHMGYYNNDLIVERLHCDIVTPARRQGYKTIWLAGISLGGYGALLYARQHGSAIDGLFLMAPFLGNRSLQAEIDRAGGLASWQAGAVAASDYDRRLWSWLQGYARQQADSSLPPLCIGYGSGDRFAASNATLAKVLPPPRVMTTEGGHDWQAWHRLWEDFLARDMLSPSPR